MSHPLFEKHRAKLDGALNAIQTRAYWAAYNEMPSPKAYGENAPDEGKRAFEAHLGSGRTYRTDKTVALAELIPEEADLLPRFREALVQVLQNIS